MLYEGLIIPFEMVPFEEMKKKQAEQYFNWYLTTIEERREYLEKYINVDGTSLMLDKTPESLIPLWEWFSKQIEVYDMSEEEIESEIQKQPKGMRDVYWGDTRKLSAKTLLIVYDISAYYGDVVVKNNPGITWGYLSKPKRLHGVNRPRLLGFAGDMSVYPYGRVEVSIWKEIRRGANHMYLYDSYQKCVDMIYKD